MLSALAAVVASTLTVTAPADGSADCPSPRQVTDALNRLEPGIVPQLVPGDAPSPTSTLRVSVAGTPGGDVRIDLADARGEIVLRRLLRAPERSQLSDCVALAETTALIVERYLREVGYEAPPLPPPEPLAGPTAPPASPPAATLTTPAPSAARPTVAWRVGVVGSGRAGDTGALDGDAAIAVGVEGAGDGPRLGARLSLGIAPLAQARWASNETATLRRFPFRLGMFLRLPAGPGHLEPGLGLGADALVITTNVAGGTQIANVSPFGDLALAYALPVTSHVYVRILSRVALAVPYDFKLLGGDSVWTTPRFLGEVGVELGFAFR